MAQAATKSGTEPRTIRFKGAVQTLAAFQPLIALQDDPIRPSALSSTGSFSPPSQSIASLIDLTGSSLAERSGETNDTTYSRNQGTRPKARC
jgi:hypothetical protein